jgi:hypothetical protein
MSKTTLTFLCTVVALIVAIVAGWILFLLTMVLYLAVEEIVFSFHWELPDPSLTAMEILYAAYLIAIGLRVYCWLKRISRSCVTA